MPNSYPIYIGKDVLVALQADILLTQYSQVIVLADENTYRDCYPALKKYLPKSHRVIGILAGEIHKTIDTCQKVWQALTELHVDRNALIINLGGGVVGDMGGFIAATYKRGIDFVQVPTTLLAQVDASIGAKVGIDFGTYKNQIGLFAEPKAVYIFPEFLATLPQREWLSGFAEVVKHYLIADSAAWQKIILHNPFDNPVELLIRNAVAIKESVVNQDPKEKGLRKILNFGHTIGHAVESYFLGFDGENVLHGEAVALGMLCEAHISWQKKLISFEDFMQIATYLQQYFRLPYIPTFSYESIYHLMRQDKKNSLQLVQCVLLSKIGKAIWNQSVSFEEFTNALQFVQSNLFEKEKSV